MTEATPPATIKTPDQRLHVFVSSTLQELAAERQVVANAVRRLRLSPVMFELGARPHPLRELYRAYLAQSHVFIGLYHQRYGWVAPGERMSGLEDEYHLSAGMPRLIYLKTPTPEREPRLEALLELIRQQDDVSYRSFSSTAELAELVEDDLALLLSERFEAQEAAADEPLEPSPNRAKPLYLAHPRQRRSPCKAEEEAAIEGMVANVGSRGGCDRG